jgi:hypothetical protein
VKLKSYKLHVANAHVRVVPETDASGAPFSGAGIDLKGELANEVFALASGMLAWIEERERGMKARSMSVDLKTGRVLITFDVGGSRPVVVRVDPPASVDLIERGAELERQLVRRSQEAIARRGA